MRLLPFASLLLALGANAAFERYVDLDRPGALQALQVSNPGHYRQVVDAMSKESLACQGAWNAYKIASAMRSLCSTRMLMTSYPPKGHLTVRLDDVLYAVTVRFDMADYRLSPAR